MEKYLNLLASIPLFEKIDAGNIPTMLRCMEAKKESFGRESFICSARDPADFIGIVLEGTIQVVQYDFHGNRTITATFQEGDMFAEAIACADIPVLPFSVQAVCDCVILFLSEDRLMHPCEGGCAFHNQLIQNLLRIVARKNVLLNQKLRYMSQKTTAQKLISFLDDQARKCGSWEFRIAYDRQALADYLGVERSAMAAEIGKLQKQGILETKKSWFRLHKTDNFNE